MCVVDLYGSQCFVLEYSDFRALTRTIHKLAVYPPAELIVPSNIVVPEKTDIAMILESHLPVKASTVPIHRRYFSFHDGMTMFKQLCLPSLVPALEPVLANQPSALSAMAAAFRYLQMARNIEFADGSIKIVHEPVLDTMMLTSSTVTHLELVNNLAGYKQHSLLAVLNHTKTVYTLL